MIPMSQPPKPPKPPVEITFSDDDLKRLRKIMVSALANVAVGIVLVLILGLVGVATFSLSAF